MTFGEKLQKLRKEKGMSQEDLASHLDVSRQAVSKWENDQGYPETEKILMIGTLFHASMDYLLKNEEDQETQNQEGYYVSRELARSFILRERKDTLWVALAVSLFILSGLPILFFPQQEDIMSMLTMVIVGIGIILLILLACKEDPYNHLRKKPLFLDHQVLLQLKEERRQVDRKNTGMLILGIVLIFAACLLAILVDDVYHMDSARADPYYAILFGIAVFLFIVSWGRSSTYEILCENGKYLNSKNKNEVLYGIVITIGMLIYIVLGMLFGDSAWSTGWVIPVILALLVAMFTHIKKS